jgi:cobaltochelatase CobS
MQEQETTASPLNAPAQVKQKVYSIRETFNLANAPEKAQVPGLEPGLANVPLVDQFYVFDEDTLRQLHIFWLSRLRALLLEGDPSAGKTSLIEQWHARLNVPVYLVPCSPDTERWQLIGQLLPREDGQGLRWHDGPVLRACREGTSVLLDEGNLLEPGVASGLNALLEGKTITIPETGETITPAPSTRFFCTQNPVDSKAMVAGRNVQDVAFDDRWSYMHVDYIKPESEKELVTRHLTSQGVKQDLATQTANIVVDVAVKVREAFRNDTAAIDKPLSTRVLIRWAKYSVMYSVALRARNMSAIHYAVRQAVRMTPEMAAAVEEMITMQAGFGPNLSSP